MEAREEVFVGVDWASEAHEVCVLDGKGTVVERFCVEHSGEGLEKLEKRLGERVGGCFSRVKVAIEVPRGAVVETLLVLGCRVFSVNPKQLDRFRDRHTVAGSKDDRRDAFVLADSLRTDGHLFREVRLPPEAMTRLREMLAVRKEVVREERRLANQLREQLLRYDPQLLSLCPGADESWLMDLLEKVPTPAQGAVFPRGQVTKILRKNRVRRLTSDDVWGRCEGVRSRRRLVWSRRHRVMRCT